MSKYFRSIQAGRYRCEYTYNKVNKRDSEKVRREKRHASSKAQQLVNDRLSRIQLTGILAETFIDRNDSYFVTLTLDELHYPVSPRKSDIRSALERQAVNYLDRIRYQCKKRKSEVFSLWAIGIGEEGRFHVHFCIAGATAEDIRDCWALGNVDYHPFGRDKAFFSDKARGWWSDTTGRANPVQIAKYLMQNGNERPVGKHPWHASRNCKRPKQQPARLVPDDTSIDPPEGAEILDKVTHSTIYGSYTVIEYILPATQRRRKRPAAQGSAKSGKNPQPRR